MVTSELTDYVKAQLGNGVPVETLKAQLLTQGWQTGDVEAVLGLKTQEMVSLKTQKGTSGKFKILVIVLGMIAAVFVGIVLLGKPNTSGNFNTSIKQTQDTNSLYKPDYIPLGFSQSPVIDKMVGQDSRTHYFIDYTNAQGNKFTLSQLPEGKETDINCSKPVEGSKSPISNFGNFTPTGASIGCMKTVGEETKSAVRAYEWLGQNTVFLITSRNNSISDEEALKVANSLSK